MNIPTPASLKKISDAKRASETTPPAVQSPTSGKSRAGSGRTDRGPQKPKQEKTSSSRPSKDGVEKKPFVRPEHLTTRPLKEHEGLQKLRNSMQKSETSSTGRKKPSGSTSRTGKPASSQGARKTASASVGKNSWAKSETSAKKPRTRNLTEEQRQALKAQINAANDPRFDHDLATSRYPEGTVVDLNSTHPPMPYPDSKNSLKKYLKTEEVLTKLAKNVTYGKKENNS